MFVDVQMVARAYVSHVQPPLLFGSHEPKVSWNGYRSKLCTPIIRWLILHTHYNLWFHRAAWGSNFDSYPNDLMSNSPLWGKWLVCRVFLPRSWQLAPRSTFPQPDHRFGVCQGRHGLIVAIPKENDWMIGLIQRVWHAKIFNITQPYHILL